MGDYSMERLIEVWDDKHGNHWEVGQDRDSLGLVEIREYDENDECESGARLTFERECAIKIAEALFEYCKDDRNFTEE
jgi:hypothetical protein